MAMDKLLASLRRSPAVDEFIVNDQRWQHRFRNLVSHEERERMGRETTATVFVDRKRGRGHSSFSPSRQQPAEPLLRDSVQRALGALGPPWRLPPPAAPARVQVHDPSWLSNPNQALDMVVEELVAALPSDMRLLEGSVHFESRTTHVNLSNGFDNQYPSNDLQERAKQNASGGARDPLNFHVRS